jgi:DNA invertase Pin-like site-specific DNA recombinase
VGKIEGSGTQKAVIGTKSEICRMLGITRMTLWRYLKAGEQETTIPTAGRRPISAAHQPVG